MQSEALSLDVQTSSFILLLTSWGHQPPTCHLQTCPLRQWEKQPDLEDYSSVPSCGTQASDFLCWAAWVCLAVKCSSLRIGEEIN